jgi:hypothetical protein
VDFLLNDASLHGQFESMEDSIAALERMMLLRERIDGFGLSASCHRRVSDGSFGDGLSMRKVVGAMHNKDRQRAVMSWLTKQGPFWEDVREHDPEDYYSCGKQVVTDTAVGEAAFLNRSGIERHLLSFSPSEYSYTPLCVTLHENGSQTPIDVGNHWEPERLGLHLESRPLAVNSWKSLETTARNRFTNLTFCAETFAPLAGTPFSQAAAERVVFLLNVLNRMQRCFDADGARTSEGHELYQDFFTGKKGGGGGRGALFTDSSDSEKNEFETRLTFPHPGNPGENLFCPWHGKVQTPQLRVHFSYPIRADEPLYVVYVGMKLTRR